MFNKAVMLLLLIGIMGCSTISDRTSATTATPTQSVQSIPSDSLFAKIQIGMGMRQVTDLIGQPADFQTGMTGKNWIPFYFGSDRIRTVYYYKGEGRLFFSGNGRVMKIDYDPTEDGYR